jgi:hypothetical protein
VFLKTSNAHIDKARSAPRNASRHNQPYPRISRQVGRVQVRIALTIGSRELIHELILECSVFRDASSVEASWPFLCLHEQVLDALVLSNAHSPRLHRFLEFESDNQAYIWLTRTFPPPPDIVERPIGIEVPADDPWAMEYLSVTKAFLARLRDKVPLTYVTTEDNVISWKGD